MKRQDDYSIDIPVTEIEENSPQTEETSLQMEELEPRVAPSAAWGS